MRFAEFKTRLFIFFAGRLLRWAKSIELEMTNGQSPPAIQVNDSNVLFAEPSHESEAVSGPPEHWARLVANGPPQHWLDLVRDKAPQLLPPSERLLPAVQAEVESFGHEEKAEQRQEGNALPDSAEERSGPRPLLPTKQNRRGTKYSSVTAKGSTWLDRLRFQPPLRRAESADPNYASNSRTRDSDSFLAAGGAAENGSESSLQQPTLSNGNPGAWSPEPETNPTIHARLNTSKLGGRLSNARHDNKTVAQQKINQRAATLSLGAKPNNMLDSRQTIARSDSDSVTDEARAKHYPDRQAGAEYEHDRSDHSESVRSDTFANGDLRQSMLERDKPEIVRNRLQLNHSNTFFERSARPASSKELDRARGGNFERQEDPSSSAGSHHLSRGRSKPESIGDQLVESSSAKRRTPLRTFDQPAAEPNRAQPRVKREARQVHDIGTPTKTRSSSAAPISATMVMDDSVSKQPPSPGTLLNVVTRTEQATGREFAPVPLAKRSVEMTTVYNEGVWPVLPPSPKFDVADELAASEQETEALRRLELEQRGTLWNA